MENSFEIENATSVDEAFEKMDKQQYDAIVSDYEMPQKNGLDFLKELREKNNQIPFILFTGKGREDVAVKALNLGVDNYINKNGSPETVYCELADAINKTVERKKSRELLAKSESKYHALVENSLQGISILQVAPIRIVFANGALGKILGYSPKELMSLSPEGIMSLVYYEDRAVFFKRLENRLRGEPADACFEFRAVQKDGSIIWLSSLANRVDYDGQPAVQGMFLDINESKKATEILYESEQRYRELANCLPDIVFETDLNGQLEFANERAAEISGYSLDMIERGSNIFQYIVPDDRDRAKKAIQRLLSGGSYVPSEYEFIRKDGTTFPALITATRRICKNKVTGFRGIILDISERKKIEKALVKSEANYRNLINGMSDSAWVIDFKGNFVDVNDAAVEMLGYSKEELLSMGVKGIDKHLSQEQIRNFANSRSRILVFETVHTAKDGKEIPVEISSSLITYNGKQAILSVARNITERKREEQELIESEEKYRTLFEQAGDYTLILEAQSTGIPIIFDANISALQTHGYTREEIIGKPITFLDAESSIDSVLRRSIKLLNNEKLTFETKHRRKDGSTIDVEVSIKKVKVGSKNLLVSVERDITERKKNEDALRQERGMLESVTKNIGAGLVMISKDYKILWMNNFLRQYTGASENDNCYSSFNTCTAICPDCGPKKIFEGADFDSREYYNQTEFNKDHPVWFELIATPIKDKDGNVVAALELTVNITAKKEAEKKLKENSGKIDLMNEKLRVVGSLTRHDVSNKLSAVAGYAYLLKKKHANEADVVKELCKMEMAVKDSMKIFDFAKMYEQLGAEELVQMNVEAKINEATTLFSGSFPKIINDCHGLTVLADSFLRQMFYNFIDNTRKYGKKTSTIKIRCEKTEADSLKLIYEDDGVGISAEKKLKLFSEGFSTGGSTGFGLFLIKKMLDVYGWTILEEGEPGKGAKFTITIPKISKNGKENYHIAT
jgi:PAS domain S-box-containing protein